jgi:branched-chain amino acid aminotransferase
MGRVITFRAQGSDLVRLDIRADTLDDATLQCEHGVYTVFRLYPGRRVFRVGAHLDRLRDSAALLGKPFAVSGDWLRDVTRRAVEESGIEVPRVRLTVPFAAPDSALVMLEPFPGVPPALYEEGVRVDLVSLKRDLPRAKNSQFIEQRKQLAAHKAEGAYELVMVNGDGFVREGSGSNFYAVLDGQLFTAAEDVLEGVARGVLLDVAPAVLPVRFDAVHRDDLPRVSEAMMTSSSRGVLPIVRIGDMRVGDGRPGPVYARLRARYDAQVESELEPL